jgi:tRNA(Ile)-lysidine synthetase-like protein
MRLRRVEPILRRALRGACALPAGSRVLVGASGGADSTALLIALHSLAPEFGLEVHAAHLHHGLRGRDADRDLEAVTSLCETLGVPLTSATWDTKRRMKTRALSGQAGLRTLRREFLMRAAKRANAVAIATAHTADDQLETLIMRLMRGSALAGLAGMRARRGGWIKPLLEATRHGIESDLSQHGVIWREDRSNADPCYLRSRIRHGVIPALIAAQAQASADDARLSRIVRARLARHAAEAAREIREAHDALRSSAKRLIDRGERTVRGTGVGSAGPDDRARNESARLPLALVRAASPALRRACLYECWQRASRNGPGLTRDHMEALLRLTTRGREGARVELPAGRCATLTRGSLIITMGALRGGRVRTPVIRPDGLRDAGGGKLRVPVAAKTSH